jgi:hypothetical protein
VSRPRAGDLGTQPRRALAWSTTSRASAARHGDDEPESDGDLGRRDRHHCEREDLSVEVPLLARERHEGEVCSVQHDLEREQDDQRTARIITPSAPIPKRIAATIYNHLLISHSHHNIINTLLSTLLLLSSHTPLLLL